MNSDHPVLYPMNCGKLIIWRAYKHCCRVRRNERDDNESECDKWSKSSRASLEEASNAKFPFAFPYLMLSLQTHLI